MRVRKEDIAARKRVEAATGISYADLVRKTIRTLDKFYQDYPERQGRFEPGKVLPPSLQVQQAIALVTAYGAIESKAETRWLLDQLIRTLTGPDYDKWVARFEQIQNIIWDTGTAPR